MDHKAEAIKAGLRAYRQALYDRPTPTALSDDALIAQVLEAAAPHLEAAARERLADRQQMVDEVKAELDDAFQFVERDGSHHSYVTREWVQVLIATQAASAAAAETKRCAQLADLNWEAVQVLSDWLDSEVAPEFKEQPLAQDWARISKVAEEVGEAIAAFVGATGQNPRKGVTHSMDDVMTELADVALTGIYALAHFVGAAQAQEVLAARQRRHHERIGLPFADLPRLGGEGGGT